MSISAAHNTMGRHQIGTTPLNLNGAFGISSEGAIIYDLDAKAAQNTDRDQFDTCEMSPPWKVSLQEQITNLIAFGHHSRAINLVTRHITDFSEEHRIQTFKALDNALDNLKSNGFEPQVNTFIGFLSDSDLGMNIEFYNTGPNSNGSMDATGEIQKLRYAIERHLEGQRHKAPDHTIGFMGISANPK